MNRRTIITLINLTITGLLVFLFVIPFYSSATDLKNEKEKLQEELQGTKDFLAKAEKASQEYREIEKEAQKMSLSLLKKEDVAEILVQIEALAMRNGLLLGSISIESPSNIEKAYNVKSSEGDGTKGASHLFPSFSTEVNVAGYYNSIKNFFENTENSILMMEISSINLRGGEGESSSEVEIASVSDVLIGNIKLNIYFEE
jgi:Tfp pilus assembly protein PilO